MQNPGVLTQAGMGGGLDRLDARSSGIANEDGLHQALAFQAQGGFDDAGIVTFGEDDPPALRLLAQALDLPGQELAGAHAVAQALGGGRQEPVADGVTEAVVDVLEMVEIDHEPGIT